MARKFQIGDPVVITYTTNDKLLGATGTIQSSDGGDYYTIAIDGKTEIVAVRLYRDCFKYRVSYKVEVRNETAHRSERIVVIPDYGDGCLNMPMFSIDKDGRVGNSSSGISNVFAGYEDYYRACLEACELYRKLYAPLLITA